jgi:hypothetical protein
MLEHAENFAAAGWPVLPLHGVTGGVCTCGKGKDCPQAGKHPDAKHGVQDATKNRERIAKFNRWERRNLGIATGDVSGLAVIDIDPRHGGPASLVELEAELGALPPTVTVETGGGGLHFYFRHWGEPVKNRANLRPGIDLRGDGGYVVAPPSLHKSGGCYRWREGCAPGERALAELPLAWRELLLSAKTKRTPLQRDRDPEKQRPGETEIPKQVVGVVVDLEALDSESREAIQRAIKGSLPQSAGERNTCIFRLCKALQGIPALAGADPFGLSPILRAWYEQARRRTSGDHSYADCLDEFLYAWPRVRFPGETNLKTIVERIKAEPAHPACEALGIQDRPRQVLVALCAELQLHHGDAPFFLSSHKAADVLPLATGGPISHVTCNKMLHGLCAAKVLELVEKETTRRARRYRFIWSSAANRPAPMPSWLDENSI